MRGLTIVLASADPARYDVALTMASAQAALGGPSRLYLHGSAVTLLAPDRGPPLLATALELGVAIIACQTALCVHAVALPDDTEAGGMISLFSSLDDDRLILA